MDGVDEADLLRLVGHHQRVRPRAAAEEADALEEVAGRDAGRGEDEVLARGEVLGAVDAALVAVAHPRAALALLVVAIPEAGLDLAAEAAQGRRGDHALRGAADAHDRVDAGALTAQLIAAERSPSEMSLIRAPAARTSAMSASWRGRSRITTVMSPTFRRGPRRSG